MDQMIISDFGSKKEDRQECLRILVNELISLESDSEKFEAYV